MKVSVILVLFNSWMTVEQCVHSILRELEADSELIVIDNASEDGCLDMVLNLAERDQRISVVANKSNLGYAPAANQGIRLSQGQHIVLLNPDTILTAGLLERVVAPLSDPVVGAVGPVSDAVSGPQFVGIHLLDWRPESVANSALRLSSTYGEETLETKLLIGFCIALRRTIFDEVGLLDEECYLGSEDLELSWRLRRHGYKLLIARDAFVHHQGGRSFKSLPSESKRRMVHESNMALLAKLRSHYGDLSDVTSEEIWGTGIFNSVLVHDESRIRAQQAIPGWFDFADIYDAMVAQADDGATFVEVGCWLGSSTSYLGQAIYRSQKEIHFSVVDTFEGVLGDELQDLLAPYGGSVLEAFLDNLRRCSVHDLVEVINENSRGAHRHFRPNSLDFVFIDANHSYEGVSADIRNFLPKIKQGGFIGGHDYMEASGVRRAVDEIFGPCRASSNSWLVQIQ